MFKTIPSDSVNSFTSIKIEELEASSKNPICECDEGEYEWYGCAEEAAFELPLLEKPTCKNCISVGDSLPYGTRLFFETEGAFVRLKDLGVKHRILVLGVIGSFTPYCWNRHLFRVINKSRYYEERGIDYICCISTNDSFTHTAWAKYLGCSDSIFMLADTTKRFTKEIGMDVVIPWLDNNIRSRRYIIYAENMVVTKILFAPNDGPNMKWDCDHLINEEVFEEPEEEYSSDSWV